MNKKNIIGLFLAMGIGSLYAGPIANQIQQYTAQYLGPNGTVTTLVRGVKPVYVPKLEALSSLVLQGAGITADIEDFVNQGVGTVEANGKKLTSDLSCSGVAINVCIANILEDINKMLTPIVNLLIAREGQGKGKGWDKGALFDLADLVAKAVEKAPNVSAETKAKVAAFKTTVANFASKANSAIDFLSAARLAINPALIASAPELTATEKKALEESIKADPLVLPSEDEIDWDKIDAEARAAEAAQEAAATAGS